MKLLLFFLTVLSVLIYFPSTQINVEPFKEKEPFEIVVKGEVEQLTTLVVDPYTQVKDILQRIQVTKDADLDALDFNHYVHANEVLTIPKKTIHACISINQASKEDLQQLKGVGPATAQAIINYREDFGRFILIEDLMNVKGIGEKKFAAMKEQICL
ncbi:MAG TPA: hypothetical protein GX741_04620 [Erysipelothrix sp.]|nr:hypothetical protein [Erysipelothrix sp.]